MKKSEKEWRKYSLIKRMFAAFNGRLEINYPNNDHPILQIFISYREQFLDMLIEDEKLKEKIFNKK